MFVYDINSNGLVERIITIINGGHDLESSLNKVRHNLFSKRGELVQIFVTRHSFRPVENNIFQARVFILDFLEELNLL